MPGCRTCSLRPVRCPRVRNTQLCVAESPVHGRDRDTPPLLLAAKEEKVREPRMRKGTRGPLC